MKYQDGFKIQVYEDEVFPDVGIYGYYIEEPFIKLRPDGLMIARMGYACDGPTWPSPKGKKYDRGAVGHDALFQLMRLEKLPRKYKKQADELLFNCWYEDGASRTAIRLCKIAMKTPFAIKCTDPANKRKILETTPAHKRRKLKKKK